MPLDLQGFTQPANQWAGIYHAADQLEKRKLRQDQLALQQQSRRAAAGTFLQNYLDPKDLMTGTAYDPLIVQGLQAAQQQGAALAAAGADAPTLMMALGPMVNKLTQYSTNAKTINKQVDDQIKLMRESGLTGYDYGKLKDLAMKSAFYKQGANGQEMVDPGEVDPSANYLQKVIEEHPEQVTTAAGLDLFAKNSPMQKTLTDQANYGPLGKLNKSKVHLIGQNWLQPEYSTEAGKQGLITGLVPKHDVATENGNPLFHEYTNELGKSIREPVRLLSENVYDDMMQRRPDIADYMRGVVKQHLKEYKDQTGKEIAINDPRAKMVARAIAYNELNNRKTPSIENANINDKLSQAEIHLNMANDPRYYTMLENEAQARAQGKENVTGVNKPVNAADVIGRVFNNDPETLQGQMIDKDGKRVFDITTLFKGGGLQAGRGANFKFKGIFYDPSSRSLTVDKEHTDQFGLKFPSTETIPEAKIGQFIRTIATSNGISINQVKTLLEKMGYKNGKFTKANAPRQLYEDDINRRKTWMESFKSPLGQSLNLTNTEQ